MAFFDEVQVIDWLWQAADGGMNNTPMSGEKTGPNPTDRGKKEWRVTFWWMEKSVPLSIVITGANINDHLLFEKTLQSIEAQRSFLGNILEWLGLSRRNLCLDKRYDAASTRRLVAQNGYVDHILCRGEEERQMQRGKKERR